MEARGVYSGPLAGKEVVAHCNIPQPTLGVRRVPSRDPPRDLHIPNPTLPNNLLSPSTTGQSQQSSAGQSQSTSPQSQSTSGKSQSTTPVQSSMASPFPASVARSLRNINPSKDNFRKIQDSIGQTLGDFKSTCQTLSYPSYP